MRDGMGIVEKRKRETTGEVNDEAEKEMVFC